MKALILAGGKGTRLKSLSKDIPKALFEIKGTPLIVRQLKQLKEQNITDVFVSVGYLANKIIAYLGNGNKYGVRITYLKEDKPLGSGGPLYFLKEKLNESLLTISCDIVLDMDFKRFYEFHKKKNAIASIVVHANDHPYDADLVVLDDDSRILKFLLKPHDNNRIYNNIINASVYIFEPEFLKFVEDNKKQNMEKDILVRSLVTNRVFAYKTREYIKDVGTPERIKKATEDMDLGLIEKLNIKNKIPAIFLDRDGVINQEKNGVFKVKDFEMIEGSSEAIRNINNSEFLTIVITNQPFVAKGQCSIKDVNKVHKYMETLLGKERAYVDEIYFCPHHPEKGWPGENPKYKIDCECRKPKTGMIEKAVEKYNIDVSKSWFIGDSTTDIMTARNAGIKSICVKTGHSCKDNKYHIKPDFFAKDLKEAINFILKNGS